MCAIVSQGKARWRFARVWLRSHKDISEWAGVAWLGGCLVGGNLLWCVARSRHCRDLARGASQRANPQSEVEEEELENGQGDEE